MSREKSDVYHAPANDPEMDAAMDRARATFKYLWRELTWEYRRIIPALEMSAIKAAFGAEGAGPDDVEHMWLGDIEFDGDEISATLINEPHRLTSVQAGDQVTLAPDRIEDWMYVIDGHVHGGFTVQTMRRRMGVAARREHDRAWGHDFGDPKHVRVVPQRTGDKPGFVGRLLGKPAVLDPDAEHPMSENMATALAERIEQDRAGFIEEANEHGLTTLHSLALGGSEACVRVLLAHGADPTRRTRSGKTAGDLAAQMGWPRVVELLRGAGRA
jgi:uncharacterized protein YegJ (DUF2314 family)